MSRFRSLRWRLTFLYLGLLAVLLLAAGVAQYFAAREVLFRTNADVLVSEYNAVFAAFRKQNASRPATALRALILSQAFSLELSSRRTAATISQAPPPRSISTRSSVRPRPITLPRPPMARPTSWCST